MSKKRAEFRGNGEDSNLVSSVQILNSYKHNLFHKKKISCISEVNKTVAKRSPSITMMKKKKVVSNTNANNSPMARSTESLRLRPKSKQKISKIEKLTNNNTIDILASKYSKNGKS